MSENQEKPLSVWVIGAGVAGMTAAHELAERRFQVTVFEKVPDERHSGPPRVGGVAASQYGRAPVPRGPQGTTSSRSMLALQEPISFRGLGIDRGAGSPCMAFEWPAFELDGSALHPNSQGPFETFLGRVAHTVMGSPQEEQLTVIVTCCSKPGQALLGGRINAIEACLGAALRGGSLAPVSASGPAPAAIAASLTQAGQGAVRLLRKSTYTRNGSPPVHIGYFSLDVDPNSQIGLGGRDYVQVRLHQELLPGEHGYRFYPSFYRNLFDTMGRIPLMEPAAVDRVSDLMAAAWEGRGSARRWVTTRDTVLDNLISVDYSAVALQSDEAPIPLPRHITQDAGAVWALLDALQRPGMNLSLRDLTRAQLKMLEFMTSCGDRRAELSQVSFLDWVCGAEAAPEFRQAIERWPQALAGLRAGMADARSHAAAAVQLGLDQVLDRPRRDATLNGPTSEAWFDPWRIYLEQELGVVFQERTLIGVEVVAPGGVEAGSRVRLEWKPPDPATEPPEPATEPPDPATEPPDPATEPPDPATEPPDFVVFALDLASWLDVTVTPGSGSGSTVIEGSPLAFVRDLHLSGASLSAGWDKEQAALGAGSVPGRAPRSAPNPSSAADHARRRLRLGDVQNGREMPFRQYGGIQFFLERDYPGLRGHIYYADSPWGLSSVSQVQFRTGRRRSAVYGGIISAIIGAWDRPGTNGKLAWDCTDQEVADEVWEQIRRGLRGKAALPPRPTYFLLDRALRCPQGQDRSNQTPFLVWDSRFAADWPERPDAYQVHFEGAVFCGNWLSTWTGLPTMESANESARHAVNAILRQLRDRRPDIGSDCDTFNLEDDELPQLARLKALDQELHRRGLPHLFQILHVYNLVDRKEGDTSLAGALARHMAAQGELGTVFAAWLRDSVRGA